MSTFTTLAGLAMIGLGSAADADSRFEVEAYDAAGGRIVGEHDRKGYAMKQARELSIGNSTQFIVHKIRLSDGGRYAVAVFVNGRNAL